MAPDRAANEPDGPAANGTEELARPFNYIPKFPVLRLVDLLLIGHCVTIIDRLVSVIRGADSAGRRKY
jgi:hypothetical protein